MQLYVHKRELHGLLNTNTFLTISDITMNGHFARIIREQKHQTYTQSVLISLHLKVHIVIFRVFKGKPDYHIM